MRSHLFLFVRGQTIKEVPKAGRLPFRTKPERSRFSGEIREKFKGFGSNLWFSSPERSETGTSGRSQHISNGHFGNP
jgi:hypothetical protein